jgi:hypothetical protein
VGRRLKRGDSVGGNLVRGWLEATGLWALGSQDLSSKGARRSSPGRSHHPATSLSLEPPTDPPIWAIIHQQLFQTLSLIRKQTGRELKKEGEQIVTLIDERPWNITTEGYEVHKALGRFIETADAD